MNPTVEMLPYFTASSRVFTTFGSSGQTSSLQLSFAAPVLLNASSPNTAEIDPTRRRS